MRRFVAAYREREKMRTATTIAILTATVGLTAAGAASAQLQRIPDTSYIQAARCEGLAKGAQQPDEALTAFVKAAERFRSPAVRDRGDQAFIDGKRAAVHDKEKAQAELAGGCQALRNPGTALPAN
jgi:putative intracellular protease/amidase